jgi:hypothetical protein
MNFGFITIPGEFRIDQNLPGIKIDKFYRNSFIDLKNELAMQKIFFIFDT